MKALKNFGRGLAWVLLIPFILVGVALIAVFGLFSFFVEFIIMSVHFFQGKRLFPPFKEDEEAMRILQGALDEANAQKEPAPVAQTNNTSQVYIQQNYYGQNPYGQMPPLPPQAPYYPPQMQGIPSHPVPGALPPQQPEAIPMENPVERPELMAFPTDEEGRQN